MTEYALHPAADGGAYRVAPRLTRFAAMLLAAVTAADFLHLAYAKAKAVSGQGPK